VFDEAMPILDFLWSRETAARSPTVPQQRLALEQRFRALAGSIPDRALARLFLSDFFRRLRATSGRGGAQAGTRQSPLALSATAGVGSARLASGIAKPEGVAERELVWPIVAYPQLLEEIEEEFASLDLVDAELAALRDAIVGWYGECGHLDPSGLRDHLCRTGFASLIGQLAGRGPARSDHDGDLDELLGSWRALVTRRRQRAEQLALALAVEAAIAAKRDREATDQLLALDRLINPRGSAGGSGVED
jgi:hypothetical protein